MKYNELNAKLQGRNKESRKIANHTYLHRIGENIALKLHNTDVVTFTPNGDKILNSGGWHTATTKARIQSAGIRIYQEKGIWYINGERFNDGMIIKANGKIKGALKDNPKADRKFKNQVKEYAKLYAEAIPLEKPSGGDCWFCSMVTTDKETLGDAFKDTEHIKSHMTEKYVVPSLAYNALKESGIGNLFIAEVFGNVPGFYADLARERLYRAVYKYVLRRFGYAV